MPDDLEADAADVQEQATPLLDPDEPVEAPDPDREADIADQAEQGLPLPVEQEPENG